jgi:hypothetical protein
MWEGPAKFARRSGLSEAMPHPSTKTGTKEWTLTPGEGISVHRTRHAPEGWVFPQTGE